MSNDEVTRERCLELIHQLCRSLKPISAGATPRYAEIGDVRAWVFDIYGTLVVSGSGDVGTAQKMSSSEALQSAFEDASIDADQDASSVGVEFLREEIQAVHAVKKRDGIDFPEVDIREVWKDVLSRLELEGLVASAEAGSIELLSVSYECRTNPVWPMTGAKRLLKQLKAAGIPLGIVSNAQFYTPLMIEALLGHSHAELGFDPQLCSWSYELGCAKPSADMFKQVLSVLKGKGIQPGEVLYVGNDMLNDVWTASRAGCRTALFAGDKRSLRLRKDDDRCSALEPDFVVTDLRQLLDVFGEPRIDTN